MMRGLDTTVRKLRRQVFEEVARLGFKANAETLCDDMEAIPYKMVNDESKYRESVYRARAVVRERLRLAMGRLRSGYTRFLPITTSTPKPFSILMSVILSRWMESLQK